VTCVSSTWFCGAKPWRRHSCPAADAWHGLAWPGSAAARAQIPQIPIAPSIPSRPSIVIAERARYSSCLPTVTFPPTPSVSSPLHCRDSSQTDARDCFGSDGQTRSRPVSVCLSACPCLSFCCRWAWSVDKRARCLIGGNSSRDRTKLQRHKKNETNEDAGSRTEGRKCALAAATGSLDKIRTRLNM